MRLEALRQRPKQELMVHALDDPVDRPGKLSRLIKTAKMPEVIASLTANQRMLDVVADRSVNVPSCRFMVPEGRVSLKRVLVVEGQLSGLQSSALANILVNAVDAEQTTVFPKRDEGRVDRKCAVIQLLRQCEPKAQRIRS